MAPGKRGSSARRKQHGKDFRRRVAPNGMSGSPGGLECYCTWRRGAWRQTVLEVVMDYARDFTQLGMEVLM